MSVLIGITGYARVGKDTTADHLVAKHGFAKVAFADAVRDLVTVLDPMLYFEPKPYVPGTAVTTVPLSQYVAEGRDDAWLKANTDYREYLKRIGNGVRSVIGEYSWIAAAELKVQDLSGPRDVVVSDVRFPNEADWIRSLGGVIWRVLRDGYGPESDFELASNAIEADYTFGAPDVPDLLGVVDLVLNEAIHDLEGGLL